MIWYYDNFGLHAYSLSMLTDWLCIRSHQPGGRLRMFKKVLALHIFLIVMKLHEQRYSFISRFLSFVTQRLWVIIYSFFKVSWEKTSFCIQVLSNTIKQKRKEKAGKWEVPLPKVSRAASPLACSFTVWCGHKMVLVLASDWMPSWPNIACALYID